VSAHRHLPAEDLLELALAERGGHGRGEELAQLRACAECARGLEQASRDLQRVGAALASLALEDPAADRALAARILERTTREDLSWRGDWREVARYVRGGLKSSRALRLLAASVLLHLLALPVLAVALVLHLREARQPWTLSYEQAAAELPQSQVAQERRHELVREPEPELPGPLSSDPERPTRKERLEHARRELLLRGAPPALRPQTPTAGGAGIAARVDQLLDARGQRLALSGGDPEPGEPAIDAPQLELALWAELLLDDWVLSGRSDPRLASALERLDGAAHGSATARLARHAQERAASLGFPLAGQEAAAEHALPSFGPGWFQDLERACAEHGVPATGSVLASWLAWGRAR